MKSNRKNTPDILNNLMGGIAIEQESIQAIQPVNNKTIMQDIDELASPVSQKAIKPENMSAIKTVMPETRKRGFHRAIS